jgi:hypothetical protein
MHHFFNVESQKIQQFNSPGLLYSISVAHGPVNVRDSRIYLRMNLIRNYRTRTL